MSEDRVGVGIIGCGRISVRYFDHMTRSFDLLEVRACSDLDRERARSMAANYEGIQVCDTDELINHPDIDIIVNLTPPSGHYDLAMKAVSTGKSVYNEKPLTVSREQATELLAAARERGVRVGCAPDTFLGAGLQTCRRQIDDGAVGKPVAATACMMYSGPDTWHPTCAFYFKPGGGPLFDVGPYYLTALVTLLGPIRKVTGMTRTTWPERTLGSGPNMGRRVTVEVPTHVAALLEFDGGAIATLTVSFDVWAHGVPGLEIYGTEGALSLPDPNTFGGPVRLLSRNGQSWLDVPLIQGYATPSRGLGVADMAHSMRHGGSHRTSGELAYHVLDVMHAVCEAANSGRHVEIKSSCERPDPLPAGLVYGSPGN